MKGPITLIIVVLALIIIASFLLYTVDERQQVVITRFGNPVRVVKDPGLHLKLPYPFEAASKFDDRVLDYDSNPEPIYTQDKKNLIVDNYAKWRIVDPLAFMRAVRNEFGAQQRLDDIIYSALREELGKHTLSEVVAANRDTIMTVVTQESDQIADSLKYGIKIIDVRIKRADLPPQNQNAVFGRMREERGRIAKRYRSEGEEEALKIRATTDLEVATLRAGAYQQAERIKGEGDAEALRIYAQAYQRDPQFYELVRTLEAYEKSIDENTVLVLPPKTQFFKYLGKGQ